MIPANLTALAQECAKELLARKQTIAVSESSAGGLVSAALLSVGGASAYFIGGSVTYSRPAGRGFLGLERLPEGMRSSTEPYVAMMAETVRKRVGADWGLAEAGAAGPSGNRYGDPAGHTCVGIAGPGEPFPANHPLAGLDLRGGSRLTIRTDSNDREANMIAFAEAALTLLRNSLKAQNA